MWIFFGLILAVRKHLLRVMISVVIPVYNESKNIRVIASKLKKQLKATEGFEIIFVDARSKGIIFHEVKKVSERHDRIKSLYFFRNFRHPKALKAGLGHANAAGGHRY